VRGLTFHGPGAVRCETVPDPGIVEPTDAIVEVALAGICGSDLHVYHGRERGLDPGTVMGHELTGRVVATGRDVRSLTSGDRVLSPFSTCCGACFFCRDGLPSRCSTGQLFGWVENGMGLAGAQAEYVRVPLADSTLVAVPEAIGDVEALLAGDVLATGVHCARLAALVPGQSCAVLGCGPVGLMAVIGARESGAVRVLAIDRVAERLALAHALGAEPVDAGAGDLVARVREATGGRGPDAVLECIGGAESARMAYELVRIGGTIAAVGVHTEAQFAFSPGEAYDKNLTLRIGRCPARALVPDLLRLLARGRHDVARIVSHRLPLAEGPRGYEIFDRKLERCTKVVLDPRAPARAGA
jgi:threonine dehydrogenase-like Zn-dependent dehydrogenase